MIISILVAMNEELLIGVNNDLPWKLQDDLEHFKNYSLNKPIIMGRKTFESIGRPLPNRKNIVVSSSMKEQDGIKVFNNLNDAIAFSKKYNEENNIDEIILIGGANVFADGLLIHDAVSMHALYETLIPTRKGSPVNLCKKSTLPGTNCNKSESSVF